MNTHCSDIVAAGATIYIEEDYLIIRDEILTSTSDTALFRNMSRLVKVFNLPDLALSIKEEIARCQAVVFLNEDQMQMVLADPNFFEVRSQYPV